ncbi:MAG TPA: hypothetical protein VFS43_08375 [Polyangiaceae bacterium]|nr:hypothetical protein [Polyangiaceae bacterium]
MTAGQLAKSGRAFGCAGLALERARPSDPPGTLDDAFLRQITELLCAEASGG